MTSATPEPSLTLREQPLNKLLLLRSHVAACGSYNHVLGQEPWRLCMTTTGMASEDSLDHTSCWLHRFCLRPSISNAAPAEAAQ